MFDMAARPVYRAGFGKATSMVQSHASCAKKRIEAQSRGTGARPTSSTCQGREGGKLFEGPLNLGCWIALRRLR